MSAIIKNNQTKMSVSLHDLSHFQSMEGDFTKKGERHEQAQRLPGYAGADTASNG